jgi:hypothetical protein
MKKYFSHENVVTFVLVTLACVLAISLMPFVRKVLPWAKKSTTTTGS